MHKKIGNYILVEKIGHGSFAEVYRATKPPGPEEYAIKMIDRTKMTSSEGDIEKEIRILLELKHQNIVTFFESQKTSNHYYLVFEYCKHGDLEHFIKKLYKDRVPEAEAQKFVFQIIEGIKAMKQKNIVHRDLKLANILVAKDFTLKLADFGLARYIENSDYLLMTLAGTPLNMDPAILGKKKYSDKCDIWSLGVIFYQILVGNVPFNPGKGGTMDDLVNLVNNQPVVFPEDLGLSDLFKDLVRKMLVVDPDKRIGFDDLFNHPWITGKVMVTEPQAGFTKLDATGILKQRWDQSRIIAKKTAVEENKQNMDKKVGNDKLSPKGSDVKMTKEEQATELMGIVFATKIYETYRSRIMKLKEIAAKIKAFEVPESNEDFQLLVVKTFMHLELMKLIKKALEHRIAIIDENKEEERLEIDFKSLFEMIYENKDSICNFQSNDKESLDFLNLIEILENLYKECLEEVEDQMESQSKIFERFKEDNIESMLIDALVHVGETTAYSEFTSENDKEKTSSYAMVSVIGNFLVFKWSFKFNEFRISWRKGEENKETDVSEAFIPGVNSMIEKNFKFRGIFQLSQKEEWKKNFNYLKNRVLFTDIDDNSPRENVERVMKLENLIQSRIDSLQSSVQNSINRY